jgi:phosphopantetheinyl transferase (holo-ACP synthase)
MQLRACTDGSVGEVEETLVLFGRDVVRIERVAKVVLRFHQRRAREFHISRELLRAETAEAF